MTFPAQWVHTDDERDSGDPDSPPTQGANELAAAFAEAPPF